jgi:hypothetical protein
MPKNSLLLCLFFLLPISFSSLHAQSLNGIYSNGEVTLFLEEITDGVQGLFIDVDETEYLVSLTYNDEGLLGYLGEFNCWIPFDTEKLTMSVTPFGPDQKPIWDQTSEYVLDFISELEASADEATYEFAWNPIHRFGTDFYPSYVLATSTWTNETIYEPEGGQYSYYGDNNGYFGISITGLPAGTSVGVIVEGSPFIKPSAYDVVLNQAGVSEIYPIIEYDYIALRNISQAQPINLKYTLYVDGEFLDSKIEVVWVRSVNDAVTWGQDHHGSDFGFNFIFAAYVNENEPTLDPILGEVLDEGIVDSWIGYQGTEDDVLQQIFALWYHFQKKGFRYSSITTQSGTDNRSAGQTVRFVKDALVTSQANCIDGTVLFASFLYKIGIDVSIVLVPGHAYLAFSGDKDGNYKYALETTMMGQLNLEHSSKQGTLYAAMNGQDEDIKNSWDSFLGAINVGTQNYINDAIPGIQQEDPRYLEINMKEARQRQIRPIK